MNRLSGDARRSFMLILFCAVFVCVATLGYVYWDSQRQAKRAAEELSAEPITRFESELRVLQGGKLLVSEAFTARAKGNLIRRGLRRAIVPYFVDASNGEHKSKVRVLSAMLDGSAVALPAPKEQAEGPVVELSRTERLSHGEHFFQLQYELEGRVVPIGDREELLFDVTSKWILLINSVNVVIRLPEFLESKSVTHKARILEGAPKEVFREVESDAVNDVESRFAPDPERKDAEMLIVETKRPVKVGERLVVFVAWPKGFVYKSLGHLSPEASVSGENKS